MWFWSFSLPLAGIAMAIAMASLPLSIGFSFPRTTSHHLPRTARIPTVSMSSEGSNDLASYSDAIVRPQESDARWINPDAIDESSIKLRGFVDRDGFVMEIFSAKLILPDKNQETFWWKTVNVHLDSNPYEVLEYVWTDELFPGALLSWRADKSIGFLRKIALGFKHFAYLLFRFASDIPTVLRKRGLELQPRVTLQDSVDQPSRPVQQIASIAFISLFLGVGPLRLTLRTFWRDVFVAGLAKNGRYLLSVPISLICLDLIRASSIDELNQKWPLNKNSTLVEVLTSFSIALQSLTIFPSAVKGLIITLLRLPILASLKIYSTASKWWQRKRGRTLDSPLDDITKQLTYGRFGNEDNYPFWMRAMIFAPLWEELFFRFAFDKGWHGIFRGTNSVTVLNSWVWANSILFGLVHACFWFPSNQFDRMIDGEVDDSEAINGGYWDNIFGALSHCTSAFLTAFLVLNPLYVRHGLSASICAHAIINSVGVARLQASLYVAQLEVEGQENQ